MSTYPNIIYEQSQVCFSCCSNPKELPIKSSSNHFLNPQSNADLVDKKISLKKYQKNRMKYSDYRLSINHSTQNQNYPKTARVFDVGQLEQQVGWSPAKPRLIHEQRHTIPRQEPQHQFNQDLISASEKFAQSASSRPETKILAKTTKIQRILPTTGYEQLKKTRKSVPFQKLINLTSLKESVCSYTQSCDARERFQESQILEDYFNPTQTRLTEIEDYMKRKDQKGSSILAQERHSMG